MITAFRNRLLTEPLKHRLPGITFAAASLVVILLSIFLLPEKLSASGSDSAVDAEGCRDDGTKDVMEQALADRVVRLKLKRGSSLADLLVQAGMSGREAYDVSVSLSEVMDMTHIQEGQEVEVLFRSSAGPKEVRIPVQYDKTVVANYREGLWETAEEWKYFETVPSLVHATVESSLYQAAKDEKIPLSVMMEAISLFSFEVDFQRDIQSGEEITLLYERLVDENGETAATGKLLYAALKLNDGDEVKAWRYERLDGEEGYYEYGGDSVRKALLKTPVDGGRISSGFGLRRHPILGYTALHRGIDFAVPSGTPVYAAGDGTVTIAGWHDQYGWRVKVRHGNFYDTMYAHFSAIAKGIVPGVKVKQGQVVGYVGSTGTSTGPHCHYEVHYYGQPVNPATLKFPPGHKLEDADLLLFQADVKALKAEFGL